MYNYFAFQAENFSNDNIETSQKPFSPSSLNVSEDILIEDNNESSVTREFDIFCNEISSESDKYSDQTTDNDSMKSDDTISYEGSESFGPQDSMSFEESTKGSETTNTAENMVSNSDLLPKVKPFNLNFH